MPSLSGSKLVDYVRFVVPRGRRQSYVRGRRNGTVLSWNRFYRPTNKSRGVEIRQHVRSILGAFKRIEDFETYSRTF